MSNCVTPIDYRALTQEEIETLTGQGCTAADWSLVQVADGFDPTRVRNVQFAGTIRLGANDGTLRDDAGIEKPCGIQNASLFDCTVGNGARITGVGVHIARYDIGDGASVEHVGTMETRPEATFGNGVEIEVLNEGGGREVVLFDRLDCQFAHLLCLHRYREGLTRSCSPLPRQKSPKPNSREGMLPRAPGSAIPSVSST